MHLDQDEFKEILLSPMPVRRCDGPAPELSVVTESVWAQQAGLFEVGVTGEVIVRNPDMSEQTDASLEIPCDSHLLTVQKSH